jgi:hypothetical protein
MQVELHQEKQKAKNQI